MINSIKNFEEECINRFEKLENEFMKDPLQLAEYVLGFTAELHNLGKHGSDDPEKSCQIKTLGYGIPYFQTVDNVS